MSSYPTVLAASLRADDATAQALKWTGFALVGTLLLTLSAKVQVPFWPVPMTMQTFVVLVLAMSYGWRLGAATLLLYLAEGAVGLPVFAGTPERGIGLAYMMGPTGGFLLGFLVAAVVTGWLADRGWSRGIVLPLLAMLAGHLIIFAAGAGWLATIVGAAKAWQVGVVPFLAGTVVKCALGAATLLGLWRIIDVRDGA